MYIQYQNDQIFLPFRVNCSQVAMFQVLPALCLHRQGERGDQPNVDSPGQLAITISNFNRIRNTLNDGEIPPELGTFNDGPSLRFEQIINILAENF